MLEQNRVTGYDVLHERQNGIRTKVTEYMDSLQSQNIKMLWRGVALYTAPKIITAVSLVLSAQTHADLNFLILKELYRHKKPFYQNSEQIFTQDTPDEEKLAAFVGQPREIYSQALWGTPAYTPDRDEEIAVGKKIFQTLVHFSGANQDFAIRQTETAQLLTQFAIVAEGQDSNTHQNLKYRLTLASFLTQIAMGIRKSLTAPESQSGAAPAVTTRSRTDALLDRIDEIL